MPAAARSPKPGPEPVRTGVSGAFAQRTERLRDSYRDTVAELRKVNWPDRETTRNLTVVVIAVSIVLGILLGGIDFVLQALFEALP
jgi:preprotein translocase subunit SecE